MTAYRPIVTLAVFGAVLVRVATSDRLLLYVRAASRPYVEIAGLVLLFIGAIGAVVTPTWLHDTRRSPLGWFVVLPIATLVLAAPPGRGVVVAARRSAPPPKPHASLALPGPDPVTVTVASVVQRAVWAPDSMRNHELRILGFVASQGRGSFHLARLSITCCVADAQQDDVVVRVPQAATVPEKGRWVTVTGRFAGIAKSDQFEPVVDATWIETAATPADPYD
jgi:uncharacterized repeat protein (TIGR03943 family)